VVVIEREADKRVMHLPKGVSEIQKDYVDFSLILLLMLNEIFKQLNMLSYSVDSWPESLLHFHVNAGI